MRGRSSPSNNEDDARFAGWPWAQRGARGRGSPQLSFDRFKGGEREARVRHDPYQRWPQPCAQHVRQ
eukprot:3949894-Pleurochrysis_carterae.AAC.1